jgi:hypothetical protein
MTLTPTDKGALLAGLGVWLLAWASFFKVNKVPILCKFVNQDKILKWINDNKALTLVCTEIINFGTHGVSSPTSAFFALGGTIWNTIMVFIGVPWICRKAKHAQSLELLKGHAK